MRQQTKGSNVKFVLGSDGASVVIPPGTSLDIRTPRVIGIATARLDEKVCAWTGRVAVTVEDRVAFVKDQGGTVTIEGVH